MEAAPPENILPEVESLVVDLARACHWTGLYQPGHPFLSERMKLLHAAVAAGAAREPSGRLLLGIARDRVLYRDVFLGEGHQLIGNFAESLYLHQVATIGFDGEATPEGLLAFFRCLHDSRSGKTDESPMKFMRREGIRGIHLYPYNYKEVLSRRIVDSVDPKEGVDRDDAMWRMLLTANVADEESERKVIEELSESPELIPAILRRAKAFAGKEGIRGSSAESSGKDMNPEVLRRVFRRIVETVQLLPEEGKRQIFLSLDEGVETPGGAPAEGPDDDALALSLTRSLADECSYKEVLDLLATLISAEEKGGKRFRKIFEIISAERDVPGSLLPMLKERAQESLRAKNYYAVRTWETIERLLLSRSEGAYLDEGHSRFMETLSGGAGSLGGTPVRKEPVEPGILAFFEESGMRRKAAIVLLELLGMEKSEPDFLDLLEEVRKMIPNMISRKEFALLDIVMGVLSSTQVKAPGESGVQVRQVIQEVDFGQVIDLYLMRDLSYEDEERSRVLLTVFGEESVPHLLDRLLMESEANRRRAMISLVVRIGLPAVPAMMEKLTDPRWYFVRNLCFILGEIGSRRTAPGLVNALSHTDSRVKKEAILALGKLKAPESTQALGRILLSEGLLSSSKEDSLRMDAASSLFRIGGTEALGYLHRGKASRRAAVRDHCTTLLRTLAAK